MNPRCRTCRFFASVGNHRGTCHRFPPLVLRPGYDAWGQWVMVQEDDWCGEHAEKE